MYIIGFGAMGLSNVYGPADAEESKAVLRRAIELGMVCTDNLSLCFGC
jgi:aryl-alcohol dehydrogenase-like predicted oxidoreductase